ncbi:hypothetical protein D3C87_1541800 [compost metagenome]
MGAADQAHGRLEPDHAVDRGRTGDRAVRLGADGHRRQANGHGHRAARGRTARRPLRIIGIARLPADRTPAADRIRRADVGPFRQIGLAEDDRPGDPQTRHQRRVTARRIGDQSHRARRRRHVARLDIVLQQDGKARQQGKWGIRRCMHLAARKHGRENRRVSPLNNAPCSASIMLDVLPHQIVRR